MSRRLLANIVLYSFLSIGGLVLVAPVLWMFIAAFMPANEINAYPPILIPHALTLANFEAVFRQIPMGHVFLNSLIVVSLITVGAVITSVATGYVFAFFDFPLKEILYWIVLSMLMIPFQVLVIPLFFITKDFNWLNTYQGLIVPFLISPFGILLVRNFLKGVPKDYFDAGRIDGMSEWGMVWRIVFPLVGPAISALSIFAFLGQWDNLQWPLVIISKNTLQTLPQGITALDSAYGNVYNLDIAAAVLVVIPTVLVFIILQRRFIEGAALSGLK